MEEPRAHPDDTVSVTLAAIDRRITEKLLHIRELIAANDRRYEEVRNEDLRARKTESDRTTDRFEEHNRFRQQVTEERVHFATAEGLNALARVLDQFKEQIQRELTLSKQQATRELNQFKEAVNIRLAESQGKQQGLSASGRIIITALGAAATLISIIVVFANLYSSR